MLRWVRNAIRKSALLNFNEVSRDRWVAAKAKLIAPGSSILDMGAGSCPYRRHFAHCDYKTQDFTALKGEQLRAGSYGQIDFICDITSIPAESSSFDMVLCTEVLEHVPEPIKALQEMSRILKPGGHLLLTAPLGSGIHQDPHHYYGGYTPYWYQRFLTQADFEMIEIFPNHGFFRFFAQESIRFLRLSNPFQGDLGFGKVIWLPFWLFFLPFFGFFIPLISISLDQLDKDKNFTVGYHVTARKKYTAM